jgi:hypothetical protein
MRNCLALGLIAVITAGAAAGAAAQPARWTATPAVRAGAADGPGALAGVFDIEIGPAGEVLVAQARLGTMAVFDSAGRYRRSIGRRGSGPGEFNVLGRLGWTGDTLWAVDFGRLHLYDEDITYVRTVPQPSVDLPASVIRMLAGPIMADGTLLGIPIPAGDAETVPVMLLSADGGPVRTLAHVVPTAGMTRTEFAEGKFISLASPWPDHTLWLNDNDGRGIVALHRAAAEQAGPASFEILRIGIRGDTLLHRRIPYTPTALSEGVSERVFGRMAQRHAERFSVTPASAERTLRATLPAPRFLPPVTDFVPGRDGTFWVRREDVRADSADWEVYDDEANLLGVVSLPARYELMRAQADRLWGVLTDSLDVPFVQVYSIERSR